MPLGAIGKCVGIDYLQFIDTFTANRAEQKSVRESGEDGPLLLSLLLNTKIPVVLMGEKEDKTIRYLLGNPSFRDAINQSDCGVYYDEQDRSIGVSWDSVQPNLLSRTKYAQAPPSKFMELSMRCPTYIEEEVAINSGLKKRLTSFGLAGTKNYSCFSVASIIEEFESVADEEEKFDNSVKSDRIKIKKDGNDDEGNTSLSGMNV